MSLPLIRLEPDAWLAALVDPRTAVTHLHIGHSTLARDYLDRCEAQHLIWFVIQGAVDVAAPREPRRVFSGQALWVNPGIEHHEWHRARSRIIYFRLRVERGGRNLRLNEDLLTTYEAWNLQRDLEELIVEAEGRRPFREACIKILLAKFFTALLRQVKAGPGESPPARRGLSYDQVNTLAEYLREHIAEPVAPEDLARTLDRSLGYMTPLFKASLGLPPRRWIVQQKLHYAARLLCDTNDPVLDVAEAVGYYDANLFSRLFRQHFAQSPTEYRRERRSDKMSTPGSRPAAGRAPH